MPQLHTHMILPEFKIDHPHGRICCLVGAGHAGDNNLYRSKLAPTIHVHMMLPEFEIYTRTVEAVAL